MPTYHSDDRLSFLDRNYHQFMQTFQQHYYILTERIKEPFLFLRWILTKYCKGILLLTQFQYLHAQSNDCE